MRIIVANDVDEALGLGTLYLESEGLQEKSRAGDVVVAPGPVVTQFKKPWQRVVFCPHRDANPFFHFLEAMWMLAGRDDVEWISEFNSRIHQYSDDGSTFHGAYGRRWRVWFGFDQIQRAAEALALDRRSRRVVLQMWDPWKDLGQSGKDFPCNTSITFTPRGDKLDMLVNNRSNDMIWGAYGSNVVHFSMLQELMCGLAGFVMGNYYQVSANFHAYIEVFNKYSAGTWAASAVTRQPYETQPTWRTEPMFINAWRFFDDLPYAVEKPTSDRRLAHGANVVMWYMVNIWRAYKAKEWSEIDNLFRTWPDSDWRTACFQWIHRRRHI